MTTEFRENKKTYILAIFGKIFITMLLFTLFSEISFTSKANSEYKKVFNTSVYVNLDSTSNGHVQKLWENEKQSTRKAKILYKYIADNFIKYSYVDYQVGDLENGERFHFATVDQYFFKLYGINVSVGKNLNDKQSTSGSSIRNVVIGSNLTEKYKLNNVYILNDPNTGLKQKYKVVGILPKGASFPFPYNIGRMQTTDNTVYSLFAKDTTDDLASLDMAIGSLVIFSNNPNALHKVVSMSKRLNLFSLNFEKVIDNTAEFLSLKHRDINIFLVIFIFLCLLFITIIGLNIAQAIRRNIRVYIVKICSGSYPFRLVKEIFNLLLGFSIIITVVAMCLVQYFSTDINNYIFCVSLLVLFIVVDALMLIAPYKKLKGDNLLNLLRSENG